MISTSQMIDKLEGMLGTDDLTPWEQQFVQRLVARKEAGEVTALTGRQLEVLDELHSKHFG
mgnify:CR=1 FL=1